MMPSTKVPAVVAVLLAGTIAIAGCGNPGAQAAAQELALEGAAYKFDGFAKCLDGLHVEASGGDDPSDLFATCADLRFALGVPEGITVADVPNPDGWGWVTSMKRSGESVNASVTIMATGRPGDISGARAVAAVCFSGTIVVGDSPIFHDDECGALADILEGSPRSRTDPSLAEIEEVLKKERADK